ncbi:SMC family ATPase [Nocardia yunnanensis]|uniref:Nuclease SbcCD subunit C n=1 Tax=Nocardia yunnanensis TaxID=2382165 RepID=A0A386Z5D1_9NOCA|nr:SMC family ATPase [Nocardia yunnanensis]AYF72776.1 SMC family ATPase [Nocardia yunnanensis]
MRLHRLELTAFGPFAETAVVDFDELGADGLFLLHGQTGAGKTTVLDAIAFALYGRVPGARAESKRLHSDHADQQTPPRVLLEATLGGRRLRLIRSPEFQRPSKRAKSGFVTENAAATLEWLDGRGQHLSRIPDIGEEVLRLLGMSADQFFQVVLLPQGDFARFLRADNEDREKLLEKLFDTERFGTAEQWLTDKRKASTAELETRKHGIDRLIAQVGVAAGLPATETAAPAESVGWSQSLLTAARTHRTDTAVELARRQQDSARVRATAEAERRRHELHRRRAAAQAQLADFAATAELRAARHTELDRARRAEPVAAALTEARTAAVTLRHRTDDATRAAEQLADRLLDPAAAELPGTVWAAADLAAAELAGTPLAADLADIEEGQAQDVPRTPSAAADLDANPLRHPGAPSSAADLDANPPRHPGAPSSAADLDANPPRHPGALLAGIHTAAGDSGQEHAGMTGGASPGAGHAARAGHVGHAARAGHVGHAARAGHVARAGHAARAGHVARELGLEAAVQRWTAHIGALDEVRGDADSAARLGRELIGLRKEQAELDGRAAKLAARLAELPEAIAAVEVRLRGASDAAAALPGLEAECQRLRTSATAAVELERRRGELAKASAAFERARVAHQEAWRRTQSLREQRMAGMAAELAEGLAEGEPCAVCGSVAHPNPAQPAEHAVSKTDEDAALAAERKAEGDRERAGQRVAELERAVEVLVERGGDVDKAELAAALNDSTRRYTEAERIAGLVDGLTAELNALRTDHTKVQDEVRECESRASATLERIVATDRRLAELSERLLAAAGADGTVERRRARLAALVEDATAVRAARVAAATAREQVAAAAVRVERLSYEAGLVATAPPVMGESGPDYAVLGEYARAVDAATRTAAQQSALEDELVAADRARAHAAAVLAEPEIQAAGDSAPADLGELENAVAQAESALNQAVAAHAEATRRVEDLEGLCSQLWAAVDRVAPLQRAHEELARLAEVVAGRGENNRRMSLRSYVLAARLEEVAVAGSVRLRRMSGGRYEFVHTDAAGPRGRRGGLGLDIRDDYTGAVRPAKTLSGGETFMASLALALGLADVVSAESGGLVMDTLFIDEGFGSLDADTLDAVMGVLDELRSGGRVVGVVSHVDEMRQRIPSRLHVIRGRTGSRLESSVGV